MNNSLISIIIPVYNAEKFLDDTIKTIKEQSYENWELIFVDDCSTDNSIELIENEMKIDNRIKLIKLEQNSGAAIARNTGIDLAQGRYLTYIDADDLWNSKKLEKQLEFMKENDCGFSFTGYEFANENGIGNGKIVRVPKTITYKQALKNTTIWTSTVMFDLEKLNKELLKMPNVRRGQDTATWWKILKNIEYAYGLDEVLSYYRRTDNTLSSNKIRALKRTWNLYRNVEHLNIFYSFYNFCWYIFNAVKRRM